MRILAAALLAVAAGCASVGPDYSTPQVEVPATWQRGSAEKEDLSRWWERLNDPQLSGLIEEALAGSLDLQAAQAKLRQARARRALAGAQRFPTLSVSAAESKAESSSTLYTAGFDANWEPDIFGGARRGVEAAQADLEASEASLASTRVSLVAEVALNYVEVRAFQSRLAIARANLDTQAETSQLTSWRSQAGLVGAVDVEQARTNLEQTRAQIPTLETGLSEAQHRLALLLGRTPEALKERLATAQAIPGVPERIAVGIPADTLRQRPDLRAAERKLAAETARIGEAEAQRYPKLQLSGTIGIENIATSLIASIAGTIFDGGRLRQQVEIQSAVKDEALVAYRQAVLTALEDVEDALAALGNSTQRAASLRTAAESARNAATLARQRYEGGLADFTTVLDSQRTLLSVEDSLAATEAESASSLVRLYKALGGGWEPA
jgi:outer membrane protein, multidrug efflux system